MLIHRLRRLLLRQLLDSDGSAEDHTHVRQVAEGGRIRVLATAYQVLLRFVHCKLLRLQLGLVLLVVGAMTTVAERLLLAQTAAAPVVLLARLKLSEAWSLVGDCNDAVRVLWIHLRLPRGSQQTARTHFFFPLFLMLSEMCRKKKSTLYL